MDETATNKSDLATIDDGSCTYPVPEPENVQIEYFSLTFGPGVSSHTYAPSINYFYGDLLILERRVSINASQDYWESVPYTFGNLSMNFAYDLTSGEIQIYGIDTTNNQPYQWTSTSTKDFRLAVIKWDGITPIEELSIEALTE